MSNSFSPYPCQIISRANGLDYEFTTSSGVTFLVYFAVETDYFEGAGFANFVVSIGFQPKTGRITRKGFRVPTEDDPQVFITIASAIENYLAAHPHHLVTWVCSRADDQETARHLLFDRKWRLLHRASPMPLRKVNLELAPREYMSIIYRTDSPFKAELEMLLPEE